MYGRIKEIHFIGIGGIGMSGIAEVLLNMGYSVTGSDLKRTEIIERLERLGASIYIGHAPENIKAPDVVVTSSAINKNNPEVLQAKSKKIPIIPRAEMLAELMRLKYGIAVAGSHGKTTTTSMISTVLDYGGFDPTIVVGGKVKTLGSNAHLGNGNFMVVEADESDGSFLMLSPVIAVVTNIDREHLDYYENIIHLQDAFSDFLNKIPFYGLAVLSADCPRVKSIIPNFRKRLVTYGFSPQADFRAEEVIVNGFETTFRVSYRDSFLGQVKLHVPGRHNAENALASFAVGMELGMSFERIRDGLAEFRGIDRRLQVKGEQKGVLIIDDYGHHPEEIRVTLRALRESFSRRLVVVFQPHRYTRTHLLFDDFVKVLKETDVLLILDIYAAGEAPIADVSSEKLAEAIKKAGHNGVFYVGKMDEAVDHALRILRPGDIVLTLGAGNVWTLGEKMMKEIS
ncbi:MAG TPA: UDP-N-acetylmuramate--L-alanine ligase [Thermodesulfobacteriota bacterium]|nr:UDP-N-acetylmuramate--L-alanine ligase [Thermodesulfobacteriota bacterium]